MGGARISAEAARADFEFLYRSMQSAHYSLFVRRPKSEYDVQLRQGMSRLAAPMGKLELVREFQPFVAFGNIGYARLDFPIAEYIDAAKAGEMILPFDIRVEGGRVFVAHSYNKESRVRPGTELLSFDGQPAAAVLEEVSRYVSGERPYMLHTQLERFFPRWFWVARGSIRELDISARTANGIQFVETMSGLPIGEVEPMKSEWTEALNTREVRVIDDRSAYLRPGPFYSTDGGQSMKGDSFRQFIDDAFGKILAAKSRTLIIDLRDNPGGDNSFSDVMVAWFANRPFRFSNDFSIRASQEIRRQFEKHTADAQSPNDIVAQMHQAIKSRNDGEIVRIELPWVTPRRDRFAGEVFVLVNRHSYSNATSAAALVRDYAFATIVGEETADLPTSYASSAQFTLPATGIVVTYPKGYFVRPNGDVGRRGVVPDVPIESAVFVAGHEAVLHATIAMISDRKP